MQQIQRSGFRLSGTLTSCGRNNLCNSAQFASIAIAEGKARTALEFRRPTKQLEDTIAGGGAGLRLLAVPDAWPREGGVPILAGGKIIGAIGVSGVLSSQDAQVATAGAEAEAAAAR